MYFVSKPLLQQNITRESLLALKGYAIRNLKDYIQIGAIYEITFFWFFGFI